MSISEDLASVADLCRIGAKQIFEQQLELGLKPDEPNKALLWEQQYTRLQGQLNSLSALNSKLTAASVLAGLQGLESQLQIIGEASKKAETRIKRINEISKLLTACAKILDLGLAILTVGATPTGVAISALVAAGIDVAQLAENEPEPV